MTHSNVVLLQIGFTALALKLNTSDSAAKEKWLDVMRKENDQMVCDHHLVMHIVHGHVAVCTQWFGC